MPGNAARGMSLVTLSTVAELVSVKAINSGFVAWYWTAANALMKSSNQPRLGYHRRVTSAGHVRHVRQLSRVQSSPPRNEPFRIAANLVKNLLRNCSNGKTSPNFWTLSWVSTWLSWKFPLYSLYHFNNITGNILWQKLLNAFLTFEGRNQAVIDGLVEVAKRRAQA